MYRTASHHHTPPPLPIPTRSLSTSTTSSTQSRPYTMDRTASPFSETTPLSPVSTGRNDTRNPGRDEVDRLGYLHSLKVALLHQHLINAPRVSPTNRFSPSPPLPSPSLTGTSPSGSRLTFNFSSPSPPMPSPPASPVSPPPTAAMTRRKSAFSLRQKKDEVLKLPKEFCIEFWTTLAEEDGDAGWKQGVSTFLSMIKKGTKTPSGLSLREIPTLLEAFTQAIPPMGPVHLHQSHFLNLLYNHLPRSSYFSPIARPQSDKDKDLLFRLRAEVQTYMLSSSPAGLNDDFASSTFNTPPPKLSPALGLGRRASGQSGTSEVRRKPSPLYLGDEMVDTVALVWGVGKDVLERDTEAIQRTGPLEQIYLGDLHSALNFLASLPNLSTSQQNRQRSLSEQINSVRQTHPDAMPLDLTPSGAFFTPPRSNEVFSRLTIRASEAGHGSKTRDLVEKCREVWGIESRREKEKEVEGVVQRWLDSIGTKEESEWGRHLAEGIRDLVSSTASTDLPKPLEAVLDKTLAVLTVSANTIFPTTELPPPRPAPSLLPIMSAGERVFFAQPHAVKAIEDLGDEIRALAVGEYVVAADAMGGLSRESSDGLEKVARWIEREVTNVRASWGTGLGPRFNPAAIILSRQLPLFCAELQSLAQPSGAADMFQLYEITGRLLEIWDEICPGQDHGFELDAFFEPHIVAWLKDTEANTTQEWVSRAVGMDSWVPEGVNKHSQSVIDLFEFVRDAAQIVLRDLPLSEYKRAVYLIDLSKTASIATRQYASTVEALFMADLNPAKPSSPSGEIAHKLEGKFGGKASSWLAKGQQAVKSLEKRKVDGFVIPPSACVKLTDMGAAQVCLDDLLFALEADETARIVKEHKLPNGAPDRTRHVFTVTVLRGENILTRGLVKGADGFVVVTDKETGERLIKTRTVLGQEDPRWEQSFEISVGRVKTLELAVFDRTLVGKHDSIGNSTFRLDPRSFVETPIRDVILPLSPRGSVHIRISMEGGEKHDVAYHLSTASRVLVRTEGDMIREISDRMSEFIKTVLSPASVAAVVKPLKDKKKPRSALSDREVEMSLAALFEYLDENFGVFSVTLTPETRLRTMSAIWHRIIDMLISLLVPPLSDKPYSKEPMGSVEIDLIFKWLQLLKAFFNAAEGGTEHGVPLTQLQSGNYKDLVMLGQYMDLPTPALKDRCAAAVKSASSRATGGGGSHGGLSIGGLTLNGVEDNERMAEVLLRIARTRPDMVEFLGQQISMLTRARIDRQAGVL